MVYTVEFNSAYCRNDCYFDFLLVISTVYGILYYTRYGSRNVDMADEMKIWLTKKKRLIPWGFYVVLYNNPLTYLVINYI